MLHDAVRLLTGSAADFLDDYFESDILKGYLASTSIIGTKVGPYSQGSGLVLLYHILGEHDGEFGAWSFHKRGNGGFTQVLARAAESFGVEIRLESPVDHVITDNGRATGVALADGTEFHAPSSSRRSTRAGPSSSSSSRASCRPTSSTRSSASGSRAPRPRSTSRSTGCRATRRSATAPTSTAGSPTSARRWSTSSAPTTTPSTAGTRSGRISIARSSRWSIRTWRPPGKAVMSCFVQYAPYHLRGSDWDTEKEDLGDTVQATLESFFPGFGDLVLQREIRTPLDIERTVGLSEGNIFAGEFLAPQMYFFRPAPGWSQYATPIDGYYQCGSGHASRRLRHGRARQAGGAADPQGPGGFPAEVRAASTLMLGPG